MATPLTLGDFDFALPPELIAQQPMAERSASRLLDGLAEPPVDRTFRDLPGLLRAGDLLVVNDTAVIKARLLGVKASGGAVEALVERVEADGGRASPTCARASRRSRARRVPLRRCVRCRGARPRRRRRLALSPALSRRPVSTCSNSTATCRCRPTSSAPTTATTSPATRPSSPSGPGAVAAPTAALHFDAALLAALAARGVERTARDAARRRRHLPAGARRRHRRPRDAQRALRGRRRGAARAIAAARARGGRVVAVGTTSLRALEAAALRGGGDALEPASGETDLFITPGLPLSRRRHAAHQLPPAEEHPADARLGVRRSRAHAGAVRPRDRVALPILQLWRRDAAGA